VCLIPLSLFFFFYLSLMAVSKYAPSLSLSLLLFFHLLILRIAGRADEEREGSLHSRALEALGI
jgi:hypothetical protein